MKKRRKEKKGFFDKATSWIVAARAVGGGLISLLFFLFFIALFFGGVSRDGLPSGNVVVIPISGIITTQGDGADWMGAETASSDIVKLLKKANESKKVKGVILEIDSPGGTPVASAEIAMAVRKVDKPVVAVIREYGASGAFWIATSTEHIVANPLSITGSIGVTASRLEIPGLLDRYNITYRRLVSGKYKDVGTPFREMRPDEKALYQNLLDKIHVAFMHQVETGRGLPKQKVKDLADGWILLGDEALEEGLVDELGGRDEAVAYLEKELNITADVGEVEKKVGLMKMLVGEFNGAFYALGRGLGSSLSQQRIV